MEGNDFAANTVTTSQDESYKFNAMPLTPPQFQDYCKNKLKQMVPKMAYYSSHEYFGMTFGKTGLVNEAGLRSKEMGFKTPLYFRTLLRLKPLTNLHCLTYKSRCLQLTRQNMYQIIPPFSKKLTQNTLG